MEDTQETLQAFQAQQQLDLKAFQAKLAAHQNSKPPHCHWKPVKGSALSPADPCKMLADNKDITIDGFQHTAKKSSTAPSPSDLNIYACGQICTIKMAETMMYGVSAACCNPHMGALVDRGAYGGVAGEDCRVLETTECLVNIEVSMIMS